MLHRCAAIAKQRQQIGEPFPARRARARVAVRLLQHFEGAAIVPHRFFSGIHRVRGVAGRDQRAGGSSRIGEAASPVQVIALRPWRRTGARSNRSSGSTAHIEAANLYQELGLAAFRSGDNPRAIEWSESALQSAERALTEPGGDAAQVRTAATTAVAHATNTIGVALARSGQLDRAREQIERSLETALDLGLLDVACRACESWRHLWIGGTETSNRHLAYRPRIASKIGAASLPSYIYANLATAALRAHRALRH